jgi:hypothetical protein
MTQETCVKCGFRADAGPLPARLDGHPLCGVCDGKPWTQPAGSKPEPVPASYVELPASAETLDPFTTETTEPQRWSRILGGESLSLTYAEPPTGPSLAEMAGVAEHDCRERLRVAHERHTQDGARVSALVASCLECGVCVPVAEATFGPYYAATVNGTRYRVMHEDHGPRPGDAAVFRFELWREDGDE